MTSVGPGEPPDPHAVVHFQSLFQILTTDVQDSRNDPLISQRKNPLHVPETEIVQLTRVCEVHDHPQQIRGNLKVSAVVPISMFKEYYVRHFKKKVVSNEKASVGEQLS